MRLSTFGYLGTRLLNCARLDQRCERSRITHHGHMPKARNDFNAHILVNRLERLLVFVRDKDLVVFADEHHDQRVAAAKISEVIVIRAEVGKEAVGVSPRTVRTFRKSKCYYRQPRKPIDVEAVENIEADNALYKGLIPSSAVHPAARQGIKAKIGGHQYIPAEKVVNRACGNTQYEPASQGMPDQRDRGLRVRFTQIRYKVGQIIFQLSDVANIPPHTGLAVSAPIECIGRDPTFA